MAKCLRIDDCGRSNAHYQNWTTLGETKAMPKPIESGEPIIQLKWRLDSCDCIVKLEAKFDSRRLEAAKKSTRDYSLRTRPPDR